MLALFLIVGFAISLALVPPEEQAFDLSERIDILGMLVLFLLSVGYIGHSLELTLRKSYMDEFVMRSDSDLIRQEKNTAQQLLSSMLPPSIIAKLKAGHEQVVDGYECVTILFCEIYQFSSWCEAQYVTDFKGRKVKVRDEISAKDVVRVLNVVYNMFDYIIDAYPKLHKVETINEVSTVEKGMYVELMKLATCFDSMNRCTWSLVAALCPVIVM